MAEEDKPKRDEKDSAGVDKPEGAGGDADGGGTATATKPKGKTKRAPKRRPPEMLPPWKVLLHNDDKNSMDHVVDTIVELTPLNELDAKKRTDEAHKTGVALLLVTHKERAELYQEQFQSKSLTVTIEPAEQ